MTWKIEIYRFIDNAEEHPTMAKLTNYFCHSHSDTWAEFLIDLLDLISEGKILYDDKHDSWIITDVNNPKLKELIEHSRRL